MNIAENAKEVRRLVDKANHDRRLVRLWLYAICFLIFAMVLVGGITRLTDSGLSITEWKPVVGVIPPISQSQWTQEFDKYRQIPEYRQIKQGMGLEEFKLIYWWEWAHRLLGRFIGLAFALPLALFWISGRLEPRLKPRLLTLLGLGAIQGFVGWWMVSSGLAVRTDVSQYRLAIHLSFACLIFAGTMWIARGLVSYSAPPAQLRLRVMAPLVVAMILLQIFLGGLVAGLDAGLAFNDWPLMDGSVIPSGLFVLDPAWLNFFENPKTVQFVHRTGGYLLWIVILLQWIATAGMAGAATHKRRAAILFALVTLQATIGIMTLMHQVPLALALLHQAGAVIVLAFAVAHWRALSGGYVPYRAIEIRR